MPWMEIFIKPLYGRIHSSQDTYSVQPNFVVSKTNQYGCNIFTNNGIYDRCLHRTAHPLLFTVRAYKT